MPPDLSKQAMSYLLQAERQAGKDDSIQALLSAPEEPTPDF